MNFDWIDLQLWLRCWDPQQREQRGTLVREHSERVAAEKNGRLQRNQHD